MVKIKLLSKYFRIDNVINRDGFKLAILRTPTIDTAGPSSRTMDHKHVVFLDYDFTARSMVEDELRIIRDEFDLTPFYLFKSSPGTNKEEIEYANWHAISATKRFMKQVITIQDRSSADQAHGLMTHNVYRSWVLRSIAKFDKDGKVIKDAPVFDSIVGDQPAGHKCWKNEVSLGHILYMLKEFQVPVLPYNKPDGCANIWMTEYDTLKR